MKLYDLKKYKLTATFIPCGDEFSIQGSFGPFDFVSHAKKCDDWRRYSLHDTAIVWTETPQGHRAKLNAINTIEYRLNKFTQVQELQEGEVREMSI